MGRGREAGLARILWLAVGAGCVRGLAGAMRSRLLGRGPRCSSQWEAGAGRGRAASLRAPVRRGRAGPGGAGVPGRAVPGALEGPESPGAAGTGPGKERVHPGLGGGRGEGAGPGLPIAVTAACRCPFHRTGTAAVSCPRGAVLGLLHLPFPSPFRAIRDLVASRSSQKRSGNLMCAVCRRPGALRGTDGAMCARDT